MTNPLMSIGHLLPPETAHRAAIHGLKLGFFDSKKVNAPCLEQTLMDLHFNNPLGIAAGFDKDAEVPIEVLKAGFFNSQGHAAGYDRLLSIKERSGPIGVNIGANKKAEDFVDDYVKGIHKFTDIADYFTINISSPNTPRRATRHLIRIKNALQFC